MPDDLSILSDHPGLLTAAGIAALIGYSLKIAAQASDTVAGMLGRLGRRWQEQDRRAVRRVRRDREARDVVVEDLRGQLAHFVERVAVLEERMAKLQAHVDLTDDYLAYDAAWHARAERHAVREGYALPPHQTFTEWRRARTP